MTARWTRRMSRVLVVTPAFHGYGDSIGNALRRRGHDVTVHPYDAHVGVWEKARHKVTVELPEQLWGRHGADRSTGAAQRATAATLEVHTAVRPDVVLVIRGDLFEPRFWDHLEEVREALRRLALRRGAPDEPRRRHLGSGHRRDQLLAPRRAVAARPGHRRPPPAQRLRPRPAGRAADGAARRDQLRRRALPRPGADAASGCTRPASPSAPTVATGRDTRSTGCAPGDGTARTCPPNETSTATRRTP